MTEPRMTPEDAFAPAELQERCLQNLALAHRVVQAFLDHGDCEIAALAESVMRGETAETARRAHRLKGASDNVAAHRLRGLASRLEQMAREGSSNLAGELPAIRAEWKVFQDSARAFLNQPASLTHPQTLHN